MAFFDRMRQTVRNIKWLVRPDGYRAMHAIHLRNLDHALKEIRATQVEMKNQLDELIRSNYSHATVLGHEMHLDPSDSVIARRLRESGIFEPFETDQLLERIQPGDVVLDIGANIGYYTLLMARECTPSGHVYAFEPDPGNSELLRRNVRRNGYENVTPIQKAVSHSSAPLKLYRNSENLGDHRTYDSDPGRESVTVDCVSIDEFVESIDRPVSFIKFDIQGFEGQALKGMSRLLSSSTPLTIFMEYWPRGLTQANSNPLDVLAELRSYGFAIQVMDEQTRTLRPADGEALLERYPIEPDTDIFFTNLVCTRGTQDAARAA